MKDSAEIQSLNLKLKIHFGCWASLDGIWEMRDRKDNKHDFEGSSGPGTVMGALHLPHWSLVTRLSCRYYKLHFMYERNGVRES